MTLKEYEKKVLKLCRKSRNVFIYLAKNDEPQTREIINNLLSHGKKVYVPICDIKRKVILISELNSLSFLKKGAYGIDEPSVIVPAEKEKMDIFFVPGRLFDREGNRKGRGEGYFDRFLEDVKGRKKIIGICLRNQYKEAININKWDISVDDVVIED